MSILAEIAVQYTAILALKAERAREQAAIHAATCRARSQALVCSTCSDLDARIATLSHAVERTLAMFDQLGAMWGPEIQPVLSLHGLTHEQIHELGGTALGWRDSAHPSVERYVISTHIRTPLGWDVAFFGSAAVSSCERCRDLLRSEATEAAQLAGVTDHSDGSGL